MVCLSAYCKSRDRFGTNSVFGRNNFNLWTKRKGKEIVRKTSIVMFEDIAAGSLPPSLLHPAISPCRTIFLNQQEQVFLSNFLLQRQIIRKLLQDRKKMLPTEENKKAVRIWIVLGGKILPRFKAV